MYDLQQSGSGRLNDVGHMSTSAPFGLSVEVLEDPTMTIAVRAATIADLAGFRHVGFATWPATYQPFAGADYVAENLDEYWSSDALLPPLLAGNCLVALDGDQIVGVSEVAEWDNDLVMWKLYVLPEHQRKGIGSQLLGAVIALARARNRAVVTEYVLANAAAGRFYAAHGFEVQSEASGPLDSVWMRLPDGPRT